MSHCQVTSWTVTPQSALYMVLALGVHHVWLQRRHLTAAIPPPPPPWHPQTSGGTLPIPKHAQDLPADLKNINEMVPRYDWRSPEAQDRLEKQLPVVLTGTGFVDPVLGKWTDECTFRGSVAIGRVVRIGSKLRRI